MMALSSRVVLAALFAVTLAACGSGKREADRAAREGILLAGNDAEPKTLDPQINTGMPEARIISTLCEGLTRLDPTDNTALAPGAAASWESNEDFTRWTFTLQPDGKWSDGKPVTAQDFVYSWQRELTPALGAQYAEMLYVIKGAEAFNLGKTDDFSSVGVKALDDHTLQVDLIGPVPYFPELVHHHSFFPVSPEVVEANGGLASRQNDWATKGKFVCNGAFTLKDWRTNQMVEVTKNPQYWNTQSVTLNGIRFFPIENAQTETAMFFGGQLHLTSGIQLGKFPVLKQSNPDELHSDPFLSAIYLGVNTTRGATKDPRVREALSLAIDRQTLTDKVLKSGQIPASGIVPPGMPGYEVAGVVHTDLERARQLLAEAGYPDGKGFPPMEILTISSEDNRKLAEVVQGMWKQNLNIDVGIYNQEWKVYLDSLQSLDFDVAFQAWAADYAYPTTFLDLFTSTSGNNHTGWANPVYDSLIRLSRVAKTEEARLGLLRQAEAVLMKDMPLIPLYWPRRNYLAQTRVKGVIPRPLGIHSYQDFSFAPE